MVEAAKKEADVIKEKKLLEAGAKPLRIGRWILRVETAAVAGIVKLTEF